MQKLTDRFEPIHPFDYPYLVPVLREYRKKMMEAIGMKPSEGYNRIFTEMRTFGARSKYWGTTRYFRTTSMLDYVSAHPTITLGSDVFEVEMRRVQGCSDYALYVNRLRRGATPKEVICEGVKAAFTALNQEINNTINTQNMQNSETTNNAISNILNIGTPAIDTPYKQYHIAIPVTLPTGVTFIYKAVVENANTEEFEVIDYEWTGNTSLAANGAVIAQTLDVLLGASGFRTLLNDLEARAIALAKCNTTPVEPAVQPAAIATNDATGQIDWIAVMRAFEEDFDLRSALIDSIGEVDCESAVDVEINSGYGRDFSVETSWDERSVADSMVDSVADSIYDFCKDQAAL
jgi:hypothetical protein